MRLIIEIPEEVTKKQIRSIKDLMDDLTVNDIIGVLNGNKIQWTLSKNDGELLIHVKSDLRGNSDYSFPTIK
tara:strand:+ start:60 stop:275 length:216 start_codon:yes stop_codon:yes gene_type:complete